jgi:beta-lactamase regulating signal transducer with metallopeptidase domain
MMENFLRFNSVALWQLAGWTMLHFLWVGAIVALSALACRAIVRRASESIRYAVALGCLCVLAGSPVEIAAWLVMHDFAHRLQFDTPTNMVAGLNFTPTPMVELAPLHEPLRRVVDGGSASVALAAGSSEKLRDVFGPRANNEAALAFETCARFLPWVWLIGAPLTFVVLATGLIGAERLRRASQVVVEGQIADACARLRSAMRISHRVSIALCDRIASPVLVGIARPIILLPPVALTGWSIEEIEMVLLHELAHVRRWDNLTNLVQRLIESLLFFHPAVWLLSGWVRREREACCDAIVIGRTQRPHAYAELLVALAAQMPRSVLFHSAATSAMANGPLRARIRRILKLEDDPMLVTRKSLLVVLSGLLVAAAVGTLYVPSPIRADEQVKAGSQGGKTLFAEMKDGTLRVTSDAASAILPPGRPDIGLVKAPFEQGAALFADGDQIKIEDIQGTSEKFKPGNIYWIKGT